MNLTEHFNLDELTYSPTAVRLSIDQTPPPSVLANLQKTAESMEQVRALLGHPIKVNSGYRSIPLNKAVGGSAKSDHLDGWAVDFVCPGFGTPKEVCRAIMDSDIDFSQCIYEGTWCHISFKPDSKRQVLTAHFANGKATYTEGIA
jgi:hypothetical protein